MKMRPKDLRKRLMVKFKGEEGLDYGGVARSVPLTRAIIIKCYINPLEICKRLCDKPKE